MNDPHDIPVPPADARPAAAALREERLNVVLADVVESLERGEKLDVPRLMQTHREFAAELHEFLGTRQQFEHLASHLRDIGREESAAGASLSHAALLAAIAGRADSSSETPRDMDPVAAGPSTSGREPQDASAGQDRPLGQLGDFQLLREVGRGGMGVVYEAHQLSLNRRVALKVLRFASALDPRQLQRFRNEALTAAQLHHPHIVPVYSVGSERGVHYYAMQYIDGQSLAGLVSELRRASDGDSAALPSLFGKSVARTQPPASGREEPSAPTHPEGRAGTTAVMAAASHTTLSTASAPAVGRGRTSWYRRVAELGLATAEALEHAHALGVIHRDIKPANLLLDARGTLWITDFGLALLQNDTGLTTSGELVGTLRFMSPEQTAGRPGLIDQRTDIYSLGATLYELLTLRPPFEGQDRHQLLRQITDEEPRPPRAIQKSIPVELETIVLKALSKSPSDRYATAGDLAEDLRRFLDDQPIRARRPSLIDRAARWSRRHRALVTAVLIALFVLTAGSLVSTAIIARAHQQTTQALENEQDRAKEARRQTERAEAAFRQARAAVDFMAQVSEDELTSREDVLEVRRMLLEGALEYYQQFLDEHHDDPSIQADMAQSQTRVERILSELDAQRDYHELGQLAILLGDRHVLDELGIAADSPADEEIKEVVGQLGRQRMEDYVKLLALPREERSERLKEAATANEQALAGVLTAAQIKRLREIALQLRGPLAMLDIELAESLEMSRPQRSEIRGLVDQFRRATWIAFSSRWTGATANPTPPPNWAAVVEKSLAVLSPEQRTRWRAMTGEPYAHPAPAGFGWGAPPPQPQRGQRPEGARPPGPIDRRPNTGPSKGDPTSSDSASGTQPERATSAPRAENGDLQVAE